MIRSLQNRNKWATSVSFFREILQMWKGWGLSCAWNEGGEMDFATWLSSSVERYGRVGSQLGVTQQPWDIGQDSAVRARS